MKATLLGIIILQFFTTPIKAQLSTSKESCPKFSLKDVNFYIPGYVDTIQTNGLKVRAIDASSLAKGFKMVSTDSSVRILSFNLTFDDRNGTIYSKPSIGDMIVEHQSNIVPLAKIKESTIVTIDNIKVQYQGVCYRIEGQVYLVR